MRSLFSWATVDGGNNPENTLQLIALLAVEAIGGSA